MAIMMMIVPIPSAVADAMAADVEADIDSEDVHAGPDPVSDMRAPANDPADMTASADIACAAAEAATRLRAGLRLGGEESEEHRRAAPFLYFIQRYAGLGPSS